jgi:CRP-like cAMP-binding protein
MSGSNRNSLGQLFHDGELIIKQGAPGDCLYVIQQGKVAVIAESDDREVKIAELGTSEFFGEMGLFEKTVRSCSVRALGEVWVLTIDRKNFYHTIQKDPSLAFRLLEKISHRLRQADIKIAELQKQLIELLAGTL